MKTEINMISGDGKGRKLSINLEGDRTLLKEMEKEIESIAKEKCMKLE